MEPDCPAPRYSRLVSRSPVFYGWIVWSVATIGWIATSPGQAFSISLFMDSFIRDFGLDRTSVSSLFALGTLIGAISLTWIGRCIDRFGNRRMAGVIAAAFALAVMGWSVISSPFALLLGLVAVRTLGQGALSLVNTTAIAAWFWKRRGMMMSVSLMLFSLWQAAYVPLIQRLLEHFNWHHVWLLMGIGIGVLVLPLLALLLRNRPEEYGLLPDGQSLLTRTGSIRKPVKEDNWTLRESLHTPIFWIFVFGRIVSPAWGSGMVLHNVSLFASFGFDARTAAANYGLLMLIAAGASLMFGWLIDHVRPGWVMTLKLAGLMIAMIAGTMLNQPGMTLIYALGFGQVMGGGAVFDTSVWTNLFGRAHQGEIRGFVTMIIVASTAFGPIMFGLCYDILGSYSPVMWLGVVLAALALVMSLFTDKPRHRYAVQPQMQAAAGD